MSSSGTETTSKAFKKANELPEGVMVITRFFEVTLTDNSLTTEAFTLKLLRNSLLPSHKNIIVLKIALFIIVLKILF